MENPLQQQQKFQVEKSEHFISDKNGCRLLTIMLVQYETIYPGTESPNTKNYLILRIT